VIRASALAVIALAAAAHADDHQPRVGAELHAGNGPFGEGAAATFEPEPWLALAAGLGRLDDRTRGGAIARVRLWNAPLSLSLGSGVWASNQSTYPDHPFGESPYSYATWDRVWWLDLDVAVEYRWRGFESRLYVGAGLPLASRGYQCMNLRGEPSCPARPLPPPTYLYAGLSLGYAFSL
jgi:hypothetical protein